VALPISAVWHGISVKSAIYCAVAYGTATSAVSSDGISWTAGTLPVSANWFAIANNGTTYCTVANGTSIAATSNDGLTWVQRVLPVSAYWYSIVWNGSVFCAIAGASSSIAATSPDGITWTQRTLPATAYWRAMAWNGTVFCAVSNTGSNIAATSPDGITWTQRTLPASGNWAQIIWNGTVFCATTDSSTVCATSPDGITWTTGALPASGTWRGLSWNGTSWCMVLNGTSNSATSSDGRNWTLRTLPSTNGWEVMAWNGQYFSVIANSTTTSIISTDGITWLTTAPPPSVYVILPLVSNVYSSGGYSVLYLPITTQGTGTVTLPLSVAVAIPNNRINLTLSVSVRLTSNVTFGLPVSVVANKLGQTAAWRPVVMLGGVDVSSRLTGQIRVEAEEGAARIAEFTLVPLPGAVLPTTWVGAAVTIDYAGQNAAGAALYPVRRFTGVVDVPDYDPIQKTTLFHCTDDLQGTLAASTRASLAGLIGGYWSEAALGVPNSNLDYANLRLSTVPGSLDMSPWRAPRLTLWAAKATPDFVLGAADLDDNSLKVALAYRGLLRNQVQISFGYRFQVARLRVMQLYWEWTPSRPYYNQITAPVAQTIIDAVNATGWGIVSSLFAIGTVIATRNGVVNATIYSDSSAVDLTTARPSNATLRINKKYSQTITEQYGITVSAPLSVAALRANTSQRSATLEAPWDATDWEKTPILINGYSQDSASGYGYGIISLGLSLVVQDTGPMPPPLPVPPALIVGTAVGETIQTMTQPGVNDRAASDAAIAALIAAAQVDILGSHRGNEVRGTLLLSPTLDLVHTLYVSAGGITAQGKVRRLIDRMDMDSGNASTEFTLAISSANATGIQPPTSTPLAPPPPAFYVPNASLVQSWYINLDTYLGASPVSVMPYSPAWAGWITNLSPTVKICGDSYLGQSGPTDCAEFFNLNYRADKLYPVNEFRIFAPGIEDAYRNPSQLTKNASYTVQIPEDLLTLTA
jgi:hypothetical protein